MEWTQQTRANPDLKRPRSDLYPRSNMRIFQLRKTRRTALGLIFGAGLVTGSPAIPSPALAESPAIVKHTLRPDRSHLQLFGQPSSKAQRIPDSKAPAITLKRINIISGRRSGAVPVRLPVDAMIDLRVDFRRGEGPNPSIGISGNGRLVGIALVRRPYGVNPEPGRFLFAGRAADCTNPGCRPDDVYNYVYDGSHEDREQRTLKAGSYMLYLVADHAPARVVLELGGRLRGTLRATPASIDAIDLHTPPTRFEHAHEAGTVWWAGSSYSAGAVGLAFSTLFVKSEELANTRIQHCQYSVIPPPPGETAYGPHCYAAAFYLGAGYDILLPSDFGDDRFVVLLLSTYHDQGTNVPSPDSGLGFYIQSPHELGEFGVNAFTLRIR
jgi:hypothetical protein